MRTGLVVTAFGVAMVPAVGFHLASSSLGRPGVAAFATQQAPTLSFASNSPFYHIERSACLTAAIGPSAAAECGSLRVVHQLPSVRTLNKGRTPTLLYNSEFAHPYVALPVRVTISSTTTQPTSVEVILYEYNVATGLKGPALVTKTWAGTEWPSGQNTTRQVMIAYDAIADTTCFCIYQAEVTNIYGTTRLAAPLWTFGVPRVNRKASPFGAGWWLAGLEKLTVAHSNQMAWYDGDGSVRLFVKAGWTDTLYYTPVYDKVDSLHYSPATQTWTKTNSEGVRTQFDVAGNHTKTIDRFGRTTQFTYSGVVLQTIVIPPNNLTYQFVYAGGRLASVTAPPIGGTQRVTQVGGSGNLITSITNPGDVAVNFAYLTGAADSNLMRRRVNRRAVVDTFTYDAAKRIQKSRIIMSGGAADIVWIIRAGETRGLPNSGTPSSSDTAKAYSLINGPRPSPVADSTVVHQTQFAAPTKIINGLNEPPTMLSYGCTRAYATIACDWLPLRIKHPTGRVVLAEYEEWPLTLRALPLRVIDSLTPVAGQRDTTRYEWDMKFDQVTKIVPPERDSTVFSVNATNGRREWMQDARADTARVVFAYDPTYVEQVTSMTLPAV